MHKAFLVLLILTGLTVFGLRAVRHAASAHETKTVRVVHGPRAQVIVRGPVPDSPPAEARQAAWVVESTWKTSVEEANPDALKRAYEKVVEYLRTSDLHFHWTPTPDYVRAKLVKDRHEESKGFKITGANEEPMYRVLLDVEITPRDWAEMVQFDHQYRVEERMLWLGKVLGGIVAVLAAVAMYIHLDERTKGFYTAWLRLAAAGFIGVVGAGLYLIS